MKKRIISWLMICCIMLSIIPLAVQAARPDPILPQWTNTITASASLSFNGTTGNVTVSVVGLNGVTNITADIRLYYKDTRGSWIEIEKDWHYDVDQMTLTAPESFTGVSGREYKIEVDITVTKGGYAEPIFKTATATCP